MVVQVDEPGGDHQALAIDDLADGSKRKRANGDNAVATDGDVTQAGFGTTPVDEQAPLEQQIGRDGRQIGGGFGLGVQC